MCLVICTMHRIPTLSFSELSVYGSFTAHGIGGMRQCLCRFSCSRIPARSNLLAVGWWWLTKQCAVSQRS